MTTKVADVRANAPENIVHAADVIGRSTACRTVFEAIYRGKKKIKTVEQLMQATGFNRKQVLTQGKRLADNHIVNQVRHEGQTGYEKDEFFARHKKRILALVANPSTRSKYPTKREPRGQQTTVVRIRVRSSQPLPERIMVDDIDSFAAVKQSRPTASGPRLSDLPETRVKRFLQEIIGEEDEFQDWGGERNDLYTDKLRFRRARRAAAFALKGRATTGPLTPKKMGKNGDQLGRLFLSEAQVFFVVYHSKVDEAVIQQMHAFAVTRTLTGARVYYCVIDGADLARLVAAYPAEFATSAQA